MTEAYLRVDGGGFAYMLRKSMRARRVRITVRAGGAVVLTVPARMPSGAGERFLREKAAWVLRTIARFKTVERPLFALRRRSRRDYMRYRDQALALVTHKAAQFSARYGVAYGRISVRNQRTCWGSCSKKGNLNFNYRILFLPERVQDYIVVHEVCHLREFNHAPAFWNLVAQMIPDYALLRQTLR